MIKSGLGGSCSDDTRPTPGSEDAAQEEEAQEADDEDSDVPLADDGDKKPAAKKPAPPKKPAPKKTVEESVNDLTDDLKAWTIADTKDMQIKTVLIYDVPVKADVVGTRDLLVVQVRAPPGAVLKTLKIKPQAEDTNCVDVTVDIDPHLSKGKFRMRSKWEALNWHLTQELESGFNTSCKADVFPGTDHERDSDSFCWSDGLKSTVNPIDPYQISFRRRPTRPGKSLYEIERVEVAGADGVEIVPCFVVTAFFFVEKPRQTRDTGDLRINASDDSDDYDYNKKTGKRARRPSHDSFDDMMAESYDGDNDGDKKPAATPKKKPPNNVGSGMFSFLSFGLFR